MGFSKDFVWGSATASYQIEGAAFEGGRGYTVWDDFCTINGNVFDGSDGSVACDHYHRYKEDVQYMKKLGMKAYRLSLAWSRLMPTGEGEVNEEGVKFYHNLFDELIANGITPYVTLFHWDLPFDLYAKGGWQNPEMVEWFAAYAELVAKLYGDKVKHFITFNEPQCFLGLGHVTGEHAPGTIMSQRSTLAMTHIMLKAHGAAVKKIRENVSGAKIGIAPTSTVACPNSDSAKDVKAARDTYFDVPEQENYLWTVSWFSDPIFFGKYPEAGLKLFEKDLPDMTKEDFELISQPLDFYGQNIYNGYMVEADEEGKPRMLTRKMGHPRTAIGWPVVPESLYWGPKFLYERYKLPILITENGLSCTDTVDLNGEIHDADRCDFYHRYLRELRRAAIDGVDVMGYFAWSLMDNFEWAKGYTERFGLIHIDYETQKRTPKDSAYWMQKVMESNGENL